ncbi:MAG TPA: phosphate acyltransferase PlsX [Longimicrobiales bacterium]|nr:phosphate acyltransferase PlsX [Longimicrobiales bacterium]
MRIALDAMGTDRHPSVEIQGAVEALRELPGEFTLVLVGDQERIEAELARITDVARDRLTIVHASQIVSPADPPATALRRKPDSSIVVGLKLLKNQEADAFISAGSTGAVMAASLFLLGALPGVDRPGVATVIPTAGAPTLLIDAGANIDCKPQHLVQFARLAAVYAEDVLGRSNPRIGLLNIGEEPEKGNEVVAETYQRLRESNLNFIGNVEGRDIIRGVCDVLVTDGFCGNVLLKFYESVASFMYTLVGKELGPAAAGIDLDRVFHMFDWTEYGGAPLLGVNGISIICHGGSPPRAIRNAVRVALQAVEKSVVGHIQREISDHEKTDAGPLRPASREKTTSSAHGYTETA